jgi:hypothetical protein
MALDQFTFTLDRCGVQSPSMEVDVDDNSGEGSYDPGHNLRPHIEPRLPLPPVSSTRMSLSSSLRLRFATNAEIIRHYPNQGVVLFTPLSGTPGKGHSRTSCCALKFDRCAVPVRSDSTDISRSRASPPRMLSTQPTVVR